MLGQAQSVRDAARTLLVGIVDVLQAKVTPIAQQLQKFPCIFSTGNEKDLLNSSINKGLDRVIHHGLVVYRKQVFIRNACYGKKPAACSASKYYTLHVRLLCVKPQPLAGLLSRALSRLLKNCVEQQFLSLFAAFSSAERFFALFFALPSAPCGVSAPFRDTTARTYCAGTVAAIRFRIRTRL